MQSWAGREVWRTCEEFGNKQINMTHVLYEKKNNKREKLQQKKDVFRSRDTEFTVYIMDTCETSRWSNTHITNYK